MFLWPGGLADLFPPAAEGAGVFGTTEFPLQANGFAEFTGFAGSAGFPDAAGLPDVDELLLDQPGGFVDMISHLSFSAIYQIALFTGFHA